MNNFTTAGSVWTQRLLRQWILSPTLAFVALVGVNLPSYAAASLKASPQQLSIWHNQLKAHATGQLGCFSAQYPDPQWHSIPCTAKPSGVKGLPKPRIKTTLSNTIGFGGSGYTLVAPSQAIIKTATVTFSGVKNISSITDMGEPLNGTAGSGLNNYTVQLNTNTVPISNNTYCKKSCTTWLQFIISNVQFGYSSNNSILLLYMQAWVLTSDKTDCQSGWTFVPAAGGAAGCYTNYNVTVLSKGFAYTDLSNFSMVAAITPDPTTGKNIASNTIHIGQQSFMSTHSDDANVAQGWNQYDFNIYGAGNGSFLVFNHGASITVNMAADYGSTTPPTCSQGATTEESNNLISGPCTVMATTPPSIQFTEAIQ
jgi:hypothetical protein